MNRGPFIFLGVFLIVATSWTFVLFKTHQEVGQLTTVLDQDLGKYVPGKTTGAAAHGKEVYQELGCIACHTQQVRVASGMDIARGWGERQSVARDYINDERSLIGNVRIGPDLSNVGARRGEMNWHLLHFYNPQINSKGTNMPAYPFLYEVREVVGEASANALILPEEFSPGEGLEVIPKRKAESLASYMLSLKVDYDLKEAPKSNEIMAEELAVALENAQ